MDIAHKIDIHCIYLIEDNIIFSNQKSHKIELIYRTNTNTSKIGNEGIEAKQKIKRINKIIFTY